MMAATCSSESIFYGNLVQQIRFKAQPLTLKDPQVYELVVRWPRRITASQVVDDDHGFRPAACVEYRFAFQHGGRGP
jgi:hypothetical protein